MDLEHPSITHTEKTGYPREVVDICSNPECEKPIHKGEDVWFYGSELYCQLSCLRDSMHRENEEEK